VKQPIEIDLAVKVYADGRKLDLYARESGGDLYTITLDGPLSRREVVEAAGHYRSWKKIDASDPGYAEVLRVVGRETVH
jgi:hypothetical protein